MPLDYLLSLLRDETLPRPERTFAAVAAGPYLHAKLSAVSLTTALDPERMSTEALEQAIDQAQAKWAAKPEWEKMADLRSRVARQGSVGKPMSGGFRTVFQSDVVFRT